MDLSDIFNSINKTKKNILENEASERVYIPFVVNKSLSYHKDTLFHANFMNIRPYLAKKMQYEYYLNAIPKGNRYGKWHKDEDSRIEPIMAYYGYSRKKAKEISALITETHLEVIKEALNRGGKS